LVEIDLYYDLWSIDYTAIPLTISARFRTAWITFDSVRGFYGFPIYQNATADLKLRLDDIDFEVRTYVHPFTPY
jgi:hypothetical protein